MSWHLKQNASGFEVKRRGVFWKQLGVFGKRINSLGMIVFLREVVKSYTSHGWQEKRAVAGLLPPIILCMTESWHTVTGVYAV